MSDPNEEKTELFPASEANPMSDASQVCPHLGSEDDPASRSLTPTDGQQCYRRGTPSPVSEAHQDRYCLSSNYAKCLKYQEKPVTPGEVASGSGRAQAVRQKKNSLSAMDIGLRALGSVVLLCGLAVILAFALQAMTTQSGPKVGLSGTPAATVGTPAATSTPYQATPSGGLAVVGTATPATTPASGLVNVAAPTVSGQVATAGPTQKPTSTLRPVTPAPTTSPTSKPAQATAAQTATPATARTAAPAGAAATATPVHTPGVVYTVKSGDTLYGIARNNGVTVADLAKANNIDVDTKVKVGQKLVLP